MKKLSIILLISILLIGVVVAGNILTANTIIKTDKNVIDKLANKKMDNITIGETTCSKSRCIARVKNNNNYIGTIYFSKLNQDKGLKTEAELLVSRDLELKKFLENYANREEARTETKLNESKVTLTDK
jgi:hypothetical protein